MSGAEPRGGAAGRRELLRKLVRYGAGSAVATVCSEVTFLTLYGALDTSTTLASILGWLAGAVPSYWLNRTWTWGRRGRPRLRTELVPYVVVVLATVALAVAATSAADAVLSGTTASSTVRSILVGAVFLLVYVLVFVLRFLLFDRLFAEKPSPPPSPASDALSRKGTT